MKKGKILIIDDDQGVLYTARMILKAHFDKIETINNPASAIDLLKKESYEIIILDMNFRSGATSGEEGIILLKKIRNLSPESHIIVDTAFGDIDLAVESMKEGAVDFITKPWEKEKLLATVNNAWQHLQVRKEVQSLQSKQRVLLQDFDQGFSEMVAVDKSMKDILNMIDKVSSTDANILILGENGTGKELVARHIHRSSQRADKPFIKVDLGAVPETLFESELFGHVKGAFTDARESRMGRFELADNGTLFLDEIGNLNLNLQAKLLSAIQNRQISRLGSSEIIPVNTRLICATNRNIEEEVKSGNFRQDLLYRIKTIVVEIPPLRQREKDIPPLINHFLNIFQKKYKKDNLKLPKHTYEKLMDYPWPGNIRELKHAVERAVIMSEENILQPEDFSIKSLERSIQLPREGETVSLTNLEKKAILDAIKQCKGNLSTAAKKLGLGRTTLYRKIKKYNLNI